MGILGLTMSSVAVAESGVAVANELCSELGTPLVVSPVPLASHGECMRYMVDGGTLWVNVSSSSFHQAYHVVDATGRVSQVIGINTYPTSGGDCVITEFLELFDGSMRVEVTAFPGETATAPVPDGFFVNYVAGLKDGTLGNGLAFGYSLGGGSSSCA